MNGQASATSGSFQPFGQQFGQVAPAQPALGQAGALGTVSVGGGASHGFGFPQQHQEEAQQAFNFGNGSPSAQFSFGQQSDGIPPIVGFGFGHPMSSAPHLQSSQTSAGFGFGQSAAPQLPSTQLSRFGVPAPMFGSGSCGIAAFGTAQARPPVNSQTPDAFKRTFDFGSSQRQERGDTNGRMEVNNVADADDQEVFDYETAKREPFAQMPAFADGGGANDSKNKSRVSKSTPALGNQGIDAEEQMRRSQRSARFATSARTTPPAIAQRSIVPPPGLPRLVGGGSAEETAIGGVPGGGGGADEDFVASIGRGPIIGTCEDMCPDAERERRQNMSDVQIFERLDPANPTRTSAELAVKRFARTVDDPHPSEFRTRAALTRTMAHLRGLLDRSDARFGLVHKFLWDRYRSVRQDLYIQGIVDDFAIRIFEEIVRFHVMCEHELCAEDQSVTDMEGFNSHLNMEQMNKALISLNDMYDKAAAEGLPAVNEAEFRSYHLLSLMAQHGKFKGDQQAFLSTLQALRPAVRAAPLVQWVLHFRNSFIAGNFVRCFALVREAPYLPACLAHTYFPALRSQALQMLSDTLSPSASRPIAIELSWLQRILATDDTSELLTLCASHGFNETAKDSDTGESTIILAKGQYVEPPPPTVKRPAKWISAKAQGPRSTWITTTAGKHLTPEEVDQLKEEIQRAENARAEAARAAQAAAETVAQVAVERQRAREEAETADQERRLREQAQARRRMEEARQKAEAARAEAAQHAAEAEQRAREEAALVKAKRRAEEEASRREDEARQREEEESRLRQIEEERRLHEAKEAERRRRAEEERKRAEECRQAVENLRIRVLQRKFFIRWVAEMQRLVAERHRRERIAASLKACRVGVAVAGPSDEEVAATVKGMKDLELLPKSSEDRTSTAGSEAQVKVDVPSLLAPSLALRNPNATDLYWKIAILGNQSSHLMQWLSALLSLGRTFIDPSAVASRDEAWARIYVNQSVDLEVQQPGWTSYFATLNSSVAFCSPNCVPDYLSNAFSGAGGIIVVGDSDAAAEAIQAIAALGANVISILPILLICDGARGVESWRDAWVAAFPNAQIRAIHVMDLQDGDRAHLGNDVTLRNGALEDGLRWLAQRAPQQSVMKVIPLEDAVHSALNAALHGCSTNRALETAYNTALRLIKKSIRAANISFEASWHWPPPELCDGPLQVWHKSETFGVLNKAVDDVQKYGISAIVESKSYEDHVGALSVQLYALASRLSALRLNLVLPPAVAAEYEAEMRKLGETDFNRMWKPDSFVSFNTARQLKRKWRHSPDTERSDIVSRTDGNISEANTLLYSVRDKRYDLRQGLAALQRQLEDEKTASELVTSRFMNLMEPTEATYKDEGVAITVPTSTALDVRALGETSGEAASGGVLEKLNAAIQKERRASRTLWSRFHGLASAFL